MSRLGRNSKHAECTVGFRSRLRVSIGPYIRVFFHRIHTVCGSRVSRVETVISERHVERMFRIADSAQDFEKT